MNELLTAKLPSDIGSLDRLYAVSVMIKAKDHHKFNPFSFCQNPAIHQTDSWLNGETLIVKFVSMIDDGILFTTYNASFRQGAVTYQAYGFSEAEAMSALEAMTFTPALSIDRFNLVHI